MSIATHAITRAGIVRVEQEINALKAKRPALIDAVKQARELGDLSENAEYHAAREALGQLEGRIQELEQILRESEVIEEAATTGTAGIGNQVTFVEEGEKPATYTLAGSGEADATRGLLSIDSPLGRALMGSKAGQTVTVKAPLGSYQVKVVAVA